MGLSRVGNAVLLAAEVRAAGYLGDLDGLDEVGAQRGRPFDRHLALLEPDAVVDFELPVFVEVVREEGAEAAVRPLVVLDRLGVGRAVEIEGGVTLLAEHEADGVPGQVHRLGPGLARLALAVGAEVVGQLFGLFGDFLIGAEVESGVGGVAVQADLAPGAAKPRGEFDQRAAGDVIDAHLAALLQVDLVVTPPPVDGREVSSQHRPGLFRQKTPVGLRRVAARPGIGLAPLAVADVAVAEEQAAVVRILPARPLRHQPRAGRIVEVMIHLVGLFTVGVGERFADVADHGPTAIGELGVVAGRVLPGETLGGRLGRDGGRQGQRFFSLKRRKDEMQLALPLGRLVEQAGRGQLGGELIALAVGQLDGPGLGGDGKQHPDRRVRAVVVAGMNNQRERLAGRKRRPRRQPGQYHGTQERSRQVELHGGTPLLVETGGSR
jgi:hypothetical protein